MYMFCNKLHNELVQTNSQQNDFVLNKSYRSEVETGDRHLVTERKCITFNGRKPINKTKNELVLRVTVTRTVQQGWQPWRVDSEYQCLTHRLASGANYHIADIGIWLWRQAQTHMSRLRPRSTLRLASCTKNTALERQRAISRGLGLPLAGHFHRNQPCYDCRTACDSDVTHADRPSETKCGARFAGHRYLPN